LYILLRLSIQTIYLIWNLQNIFWYPFGQL